MKEVVDYFKKIFFEFSWKNEKRIFYQKKHDDKLIFCIEFQKYSFKHENRSPYTLNFTILCPFIYMQYFKSELNGIKPENGIVNMRPYEFFKSLKRTEKFKEFWYVEDFDAEKTALEKMFRELVFPFFESIDTYEDLFEFITANKIQLFGAQQEQFKLLAKKVDNES